MTEVKVPLWRNFGTSYSQAGHSPSILYLPRIWIKSGLTLQTTGKPMQNKTIARAAARGTFMGETKMARTPGQSRQFT